MRPLVDELLHEGVVLGDLAEAVRRGAGRRGSRRCGPSPACCRCAAWRSSCCPSRELGVVLRIARRRLEFACARTPRAGRQRLVGADALGVERGELPDDQRAGDVARGVAPHPVGEHEEVRTGIPAVLVAGLRSQAEVGARRVAQGDGHRSAPQLEHGAPDPDHGADLDGTAPVILTPPTMKVPLRRAEVLDEPAPRLRVGKMRRAGPRRSRRRARACTRGRGR